MKLRTIALQSKLRLVQLAIRMRVVAGEFIAAVLPVNIVTTIELVAKRFGRARSDTAQFTDKAVVVPNKRPSDAVGITDGGEGAYFAQDYVTGAPSAQTYTLVGGFVWNLSKPVAESPRVTDRVAKALPSKSFNEANYATDDVNGAAAGDDQIMRYFKVTTDLNLVSDTLNSKRVGKALSETPRVSDVIAKALPSKVFTESTVVTDARINRVRKIIANATSATDAISNRNVQKVLLEAPRAASSGALRSQNYTVDMSYFAEDYVGASRVFS